jgi:hypothetical protein
MLAWGLSLLANLGPLALLGGPLGLGIAWVGSLFANSTAKLIAITIGLLLLVGVSVGLTIRIQHLERDAAAYQGLAAEMQSLGAHYGCPTRPQAERELAVCLTARERDAAAAQAEEIRHQRDEAALAQQALDAENVLLQKQQNTADQAIDAAPKGEDGPVPRVLLDAWMRERSERGIK